MATSGTVGLTVLDTATVIEHAFRRCRVPTAKQTAESVQIAKNNLYLLLTHLANRGLNLWCVEKQLVGLAAGQATYAAPTGTVDVLNVVYSQPTRVTGTDTALDHSYATQLSTATAVQRFGIKMSYIQDGPTLTFEHSHDGISWTTSLTYTPSTWVANKWYWFDLPINTTATHFRANFGNKNITVTEFYLATAVYDLPVTQWNRDTFAAINNKAQQGRPSTTYYFEKLLTPQVTLWPVPNNDYDHLTLFSHRQVQDVGTLTQQLEVPQRWVEAITWQLASRLCYELDAVDPGWMTNVVQMMEKVTAEVEDEEGDGAPIYLSSNIRVYTR